MARLKRRTAVFTMRMEPNEREWLRKLAADRKIPESELVVLMLRRAVSESVSNGTQRVRTDTGPGEAGESVSNGTQSPGEDLTALPGPGGLVTGVGGQNANLVGMPEGADRSPQTTPTTMPDMSYSVGTLRTRSDDVAHWRRVVRSDVGGGK